MCFYTSWNWLKPISDFIYNATPLVNSSPCWASSYSKVRKGFNSCDRTNSIQSFKCWYESWIRSVLTIVKQDSLKLWLWVKNIFLCKSIFFSLVRGRYCQLCFCRYPLAQSELLKNVFWSFRCLKPCTLSTISIEIQELKWFSGVLTISF